MKNNLIQRVHLILLLIGVTYVGVSAQQKTSLEERVVRLERKVNELEVLVKRLAPEPTRSTENGQQRIESNRDAIINDLNNLAAQAYRYRIKPKAMAGGGGSYVGFEISQMLKGNQNATYVVRAIEANSVTVSATSAKGYGTISATIDSNGRLANWKYSGTFKAD